MQTKSFLRAVLFSAICLVSAEPAPQPDAQTTNPPSAAESKASHDLDVYIASITADPKWPSVSAVVLKDTPFSLHDLLIAPLSLITSNPMFSSFPKEDQDLIISANKMAAGIISMDLSSDGPMPTGTATKMATGMTTGTSMGTMMGTSMDTSMGTSMGTSMSTATGTATGTAMGTATAAGASKLTGAVIAAGAAAAGLLGVVALL